MPPGADKREDVWRGMSQTSERCLSSMLLLLFFPKMGSVAVAAFWNVERAFVPAAGMRESASEIKEEILFVAHFQSCSSLCSCRAEGQGQKKPSLALIWLHAHLCVLGLCVHQVNRKHPASSSPVAFIPVKNPQVMRNLYHTYIC